MNGDNYSSRDGRRVREYPPSRGDRDERRDRHRDRERERERDHNRDHNRDYTRDHTRDQNRERERERQRERDRDRDRGRERNLERRRSRSPELRAPRRPDPEFDAYSSSRSHRDREREDRYSGRDRRGEREWDRDRDALPRRDVRREDEERPARRDREPFEDRRRGTRDRRDEGGFLRHEARRSPTLVVQREPTPDLTDVVPVLERKRRLTQWDIKPPGYELVTSEQAKLSGMFPLPGAPRQQAMDPTKLQAFMNHPAGQVTSSALKASNSRQSKRLIVYNVPPETSEENLMSFFNLQLNGLNVIESTDPCILCQFSNDRSFAVLEFKHAMEATVGLALDGITMDNGTVNESSISEASRLTIRRPKDYVMPAIPEGLIYDPSVISSHVPDTLHKLCISNIPPFLSEDQVLELLASFGKLKAFVLVKNRSTEESRGIAFIEYLEPTAANETALTTLDGMDVGGRKLRVTKASSGSTQVANFDVGITAISGLASQLSNETDKGRVIQLLNMVTPEELMDIEEYQEICDDVREECAKYGTVLELKAPRPSGGGRQSAGVGKIFVKFDSAASAHKALTALAGRKFADRTVVTTYFPEASMHHIKYRVENLTR